MVSVSKTVVLSGSPASDGCPSALTENYGTGTFNEIVLIEIAASALAHRRHRAQPAKETFP